MQNITRHDLIKKTSDQTGVRQSDVTLILDNLLETITSQLAKGNSITIRRFGSFDVREIKGKIPPRAVVKFNPGKEMKERVAPILPLIRQERKK